MDMEYLRFVAVVKIDGKFQFMEVEDEERAETLLSTYPSTYVHDADKPYDMELIWILPFPPTSGKIAELIYRIYQSLEMFDSLKSDEPPAPPSIYPAESY